MTSHFNKKKLIISFTFMPAVNMGKWDLVIKNSEYHLSILEQKRLLLLYLWKYNYWLLVYLYEMSFSRGVKEKCCKTSYY